MDLLELPRIPAAIIAFLGPLTLFYILSRECVFPGTRRGVAKGYLYFTVNVVVGFLVMLAGVLGTDAVRRTLPSDREGAGVHFLNGVFNFKEL